MIFVRLAQMLLLWSLALPVVADPIEFAAIVTFITTYAVAIQIALTVTLTVYSSASARRKLRRMESEARAAFNSRLEDRCVTVLQAAPPLPIVYGEAITGGYTVAMFTSDSTRIRDDGSSFTKPDALQHLVIVFAGHQVQSIGEVYIAGVPIGALDGSGWVTGGSFAVGPTTVYRELLIAAGGNYVAPSAVTVLAAWDTAQSSYNPDAGVNLVAGSYSLTVGGTQINNTSGNQLSVSFSYQSTIPRVRVDKFLGTDTQTANAYLNGLMPLQWTSNHRLRGLAGIVITLDLEDPRFQPGPPQITAAVKGKLVFDTRTSTTAWSDNSALCLRDYLNSWLGLNVPAAYIDTAFCNAAANACDVGINIVDFARANNWFRFNTESDLEGWTSAGATLTVTGGNAVLNSTSTDPNFIRNNLSPTVAGTTHRAVRARIKRVAGSGWDGLCFFDNTTHGFSGSYYKQISEPTYDPVTGWAEVLWDMTTLTAGGSDWTTSTIRHIRLDLGNSASDNFLIDWVVVGPLLAPTYTLNGTFTTDDGKESTLDLMAESMMGSATYGASWLINAGAWTSPVMDLVDDDLDGQISLPQTNTPLEELFNGIRGVYIPYGSQVPVDFDSYQNSTYVTDDGGALWHDFRLPFCNSGIRATNLARIKTETERLGQIIQYPAKLKAFPLQIGDRVRVTSTEYGYSLTTFRVTDWQFSAESAVVLTLQRDVSASYSLIAGASADPVPNSALPNPWAVVAPTGVSAASGTSHLLVQADGTIATRVKVTWTATTDAYIIDEPGKVRVRYRRQWVDGTGVWHVIDMPGDQTGVYLTGMMDGESLSIGVQFINGLGVKSTETVIQHAVVGKTQVPANVAGLAVSIVQGGARISWNKPAELDYDSTEIRYGASWAAGTFLFRGNASNWTWLTPAQGTYTARAKHYDTSGNESATDQTVSVVVDAAALVVWASITGTGKPADNATKNTVTYSASAPGGPTDGDIWVDTSTTPNLSKYRISGAWQVGANYSTNTNQLTDGANLGGTATWTGVSGTGKPADYATKNTVTYSSSAPGSPTDGDIWVDTTTTPTISKYRISGVWQVGANYVTNTTQLADGANLGGTATWTGVSGTGKPADYATKNTVTYSASAPGSPTDGDIWVDTSTTPNLSKYRISGVWQVGANYVTNTSHLSDGANLGGTATWTGVSGAGKPADNATVGATLGTNVSGQITSGNVSGLVADDAIPATKISSLNADKLTAGSIRGINTQSAAFMTKGTFLVGVPAAGAATVTVGNTADFAASGTFIVIDSTNDRDVVVYTGKTSTTFTGCTTSGGNAILGSHNDGATVVPLLKGMVIDDITNEMRFYGDRGDGVIEELASIGVSSSAGDPVVGVFGSSSTSSTRTGLFAYSGTRYALDAFNTTTEASGYPTIRARNNSSGRAIQGESTTGFGVFGQGGGTSAGTYGSNSSSGPGVEGTSTSGYGVFGHTATTVAAVYGENTSTGPGVRGKSTSSGPGLKGEASTGYGAELVGNSTKAPLYLTPGSAPSGKAQGALYVESSNSTLQLANGSIWQEIAIVGASPPPPPATCFPAGAQVLLADGSWKPIQTISTKDALWGPWGPVRVVKIDRPLLGSRRMMMFADGHTWSEEHAHWTRAPDSTQWWWSFGKKAWLAEVESKQIGGLFDNEGIRTGDRDIEFAHVSGWRKNEIRLSRDYSSSSRLYLPVTDGSPIIVNGYVCGASINQWNFDYTKLDWNKVLIKIGELNGRRDTT